MRTRVYKYGLVPIGYPPQEAVDELWRANNLWNTLVALHRESRENWDDARRAASIAYSEKMDALEKKQEEISQAFDVLRQVRMEEGTKDESNPKLKLQRDVINRLKKEQGVIFDELKPLRKDADKAIDKKALNDDYRKKCNEAVSVKNCGIYRRTADQIYANFRTAREKAFKDNATMRFHRFDGTGYFQFRCTRKGSNTDGITVDEFMQGSFTEYMRCAVTAVDNTKKKPRIRINAVLTGGATKASKVFQEFDWIYHRPLPPEAQIQNGKILRTRAGDKFRYDLVLTVKLPETDVLDASKLSGAIGIDVGFRRQGNTILIGTLMSDASNTAAQEITVPPQMISAMEHIIELQGELDDAATDLGKAITPYLSRIHRLKITRSIGCGVLWRIDQHM